MYIYIYVFINIYIYIYIYIYIIYIYVSIYEILKLCEDIDKVRNKLVRNKIKNG